MSTPACINSLEQHSLSVSPQFYSGNVYLDKLARHLLSVQAAKALQQRCREFLISQLPEEYATDVKFAAGDAEGSTVNAGGVQIAGL